MSSLVITAVAIDVFILILVMSSEDRHQGIGTTIIDILVLDTIDTISPRLVLHVLFGETFSIHINNNEINLK